MKDKTFTWMLILGLVIVGGIVLLTLRPSEEPDPAALSSKSSVHQFHIELDFTSPQRADTTFVCALALDAPAARDTMIQLHCTNTNLVTAEGGDKFPKSLIIPTGSDRSSVSLHTGKPKGNTNMTIAAGPAGVDMSNSANWQASKMLVIRDASPSSNKP